MKIKARKYLVYRMLHWYEEKLSEVFVNQHMTQATKYRMEAVIKNIQQQQMQAEPQSEMWQFPIVLNFNNISGAVSIRIDPVFEAERILYIDYP